MRKISVILALITASVLIGCGEVKETNDLLDSSANANIETPSEPIEEVVTDEKKPVEDSTIPEKKTEEVAAEVEEEEPVFEGMTEEWAGEKLIAAMNAYKELAENAVTKEIEANALYCTFDGTTTHSDLTTKDGVTLNYSNDEEGDKVFLIYLGTCYKYYYDYINNNGEYFDFADYISSHNFDEIAQYSSSMVNCSDTSEVCMANINYCEWILGTLSVQNITDEISVNYKNIFMPNDERIEVAYQCDVYLDDKDTGLKLVFDKDGNLLNINDENNIIDKKIPF